MMCIGIFCNRKDIFDRAYEQCLKGTSNGAINYYFAENGQCQERGRDQGHAQMGPGFVTPVCEIACKQGYDLYAAYHNRLATGYEYTAKYMLGADVPYSRSTNFQGKAVLGDTISSQGRGHFYPSTKGFITSTTTVGTWNCLIQNGPGAKPARRGYPELCAPGQPHHDGFSAEIKRCIFLQRESVGSVVPKWNYLFRDSAWKSPCG